MKFFKKNFTKILMAFTLAITSLFIAFGCNTYAYTLDNNGNLVSDNLLSPECLYPNHNVNGDGTLGNLTIYSSYYKVPVSPNTDYTLSYVGSVYNLGVATYDNNGNFLSYVTWNNSKGSTANNVYFISFDFPNSYSNLMLNTGLTALDYEPYGIWYNENDYNQLQDNYDTLMNQYLNLKNRYLYGFFADLSELHLIGTSSGVSSIDEYFSLQDLINSNYFSNGTFLLNNFITNISGSYDSASIKFSFAPNLIPSNVDIIFTGNQNFNFIFNIVFSDNSVYHSGISNENNFIFHENLNNLSISNGGVPIVNFNFSFSNGDYIPNMNFGSDYGVAYNTGFSDAQNLSLQTINNLENQITSLYGEISNLGSTINTLQSAYNDLNQSYNNLLGGNSFANLFFTIAETPFASFKQIWNVDFLGVNLAGFVTGILFIGLIIWVIKKIF